MASPQLPTTIENLPGEILSEIFVRLLAKEVAQMRCVSKSWNALLSHPSFIKSHLNRSIQNNDEILLFVGLLFSFDFGSSPFRARPSCSPDLELGNFIKPPAIFQSKFGLGLLIGSVNGLICFCYKSSVDFLVHIWNPSLSALLTLPPSSLPCNKFHFGFGFDPKTDDYKVVKLTSFSLTPGMVLQGEVYSMRKGSWDSITQRLPTHTTNIGGHISQVCVNDHLHWLCDTDFEWKPQTVVAFDLGAETFSELPLPDYLLHNLEDRLNVLGVLVGKLCVMSCVFDGECEVWVMDEYGVADSWAKHQVFPPFSCDIIPYGFTSHGEFLFQVDHNDDHFGLYDPIAAKTMTFKITSRNSTKMKFVEYVDSLVWVPPPNREISNCDISQLQIGK